MLPPAFMHKLVPATLPGSYGALKALGFLMTFPMGLPRMPDIPTVHLILDPGPE